MGDCGQLQLGRLFLGGHLLELLSLGDFFLLFLGFCSNSVNFGLLFGLGLSKPPLKPGQCVVQVLLLLLFDQLLQV